MHISRERLGEKEIEVAAILLRLMNAKIKVVIRNNLLRTLSTFKWGANPSTVKRSFSIELPYG